MRPLGAMAIATLGFVAALILSACGLLGFGLGDDEIPSELSSGHRSDIHEEIERFFIGVNAYNAGMASPSMLIPVELGISTVRGMVWELAALQEDEISIELRTLENFAVLVAPDNTPTSVIANAFVVVDGSPQAIPVEFVRRDGRWLLSRVPNLSFPAELGLTHVLATVDSISIDNRNNPIIVGTISNAGNELVHIPNAAAILDDADGNTIGSVGAQWIALPFLEPGESTPARFYVDDWDDESLENVRLIPFARIPDENDVDLIFRPSVRSVEHLRVGDTDAVAAIVQKNVDDPARLFATALARDAAGNILAIGPGMAAGELVISNLERRLQVALIDLSILNLQDAAATYDLIIWGQIDR